MMEVNLVSYSQADGNFLIDSASAMEMVAYCARCQTLIIK